MPSTTSSHLSISPRRSSDTPDARTPSLRSSLQPHVSSLRSFKMPFHQSGPALYAPPTVIHDVDQPERVWNLSTNPKFDHWAAYGNAGAPSAPRLSAAPARSYAVTHSWTNWPSDWSLTQPMHCPHSSHIAPSPQIQLHQQVEQELLQAHRLSQSSARMEPLTSVRQVQMPFEHRHGQPVPPVAASVRLADSMQAWSEGTSPPSAALVEKARPPFASAASEILNLANVTTGLVIMLSDRLAEGILTDKSNPPHAGPLFVPSTGPLNEVLNFGSQAFCVPQEQSAKFLSLQLHDEELAPVNLASLPGTLEEPRAVMVLHEFVKKLLSQTVSYPNALFLGIFYISQVPTFLERQPHALREFERIFLKPQYSAPFKLLTLGLMMSNSESTTSAAGSFT